MEKLLKDMNKSGLDDFKDELSALIREKRAFLDQGIGNFGKFGRAAAQIPAVTPSAVQLDKPTITIGAPDDLDEDQAQTIKASLLELRPWRKGPFDVFGVHVDAEWRSWMKWDRLTPHISDLKGRRVLDIGSSNGYYMFRMAAHDPLMVLGLEPQSLFYCQYLALQKLLNQENVYCLPVTHDELPRMTACFDTVFCMGVLYHRRSPVRMLKAVHDALCPGGELVLENLVIQGENNRCFFPEDRYAKMRNVFFIPDISVMTSWLKRAGFKTVQCVDVTPTTTVEQRKTDWIRTESLADFLDPLNPEKTVEGHPAPVRAVFIAGA